MPKKLPFSRFVISALLLTGLIASPAGAINSPEIIAKITQTQGGVFAMEAFKDQLYIGMFGYGSNPNQGMLYRYDSKKGKTREIKGLSQSDLGKAESICALKEFKGQLYAATEEKGRFFRSTNGSDWDLVHTGSHPIACSLEIHNNVLFASSSSHAPPNQKGEILYTASGDKGSWIIADIQGAPGYIRDLVSHGNTLYGFSVYNNQGRWLSSTDGTHWDNQPTSKLFGSNTRVFRSKSIGDTLWLGTAQYGVKNGATGIWSLQGEQLSNKYNTDKYSHVTGFEIGFAKGTDKPVLIATVSSGFKSEGLNNGSAVLKSEDDGNSWKVLNSFPDEEGSWAITPYKNQLYVSTMHGGTPNTRGAFGRIIKLKNIRTKPYISKPWLSRLKLKFKAKT